MTKRKNVVTVGLMLMILILTLTLFGCVANIDGEYKGYSKGFNFEGYLWSSITCAARSEKTDFDVSDVTLDFYFGWLSELIGAGNPGEERITLAVYLSVDPVGSSLSIIEIKDYKNIEDHIYLKEISEEEFESDSYKVVMTKSKGKQFNHKETFTIPKEMFDETNGTIYFCIRDIWEMPRGVLGIPNEIMARDIGFVSIHYRFVDENTVRLRRIF